MTKLLTNPLFPILGALVLFILADAVFAGRSATAYPFTGYTTIPKNEPYPGQHVVPVPPIHTIDFEIQQVPVRGKLEWYGRVTVNKGDSYETVYQVDSHKLTFEAR